MIAYTPFNILIRNLIEEKKIDPDNVEMINVYDPQTNKLAGFRASFTLPNGLYRVWYESAENLRKMKADTMKHKGSLWHTHFEELGRIFVMKKLINDTFFKK